MLYDEKPGDCFVYKSQGQPVTVMQFTGLVDKNGKEIYEGDILNWDFCGTVEWKDWMKEPAYKVVYEYGYHVCGKGLHKDLFLHAYRFRHTEVIGNIYENKELLSSKAYSWSDRGVI
jgi:uncharacterized phage protein (TIGR01671 family)